MASFHHIIFDLGGVLLNIDYQKTADAFAALGIGNFSELYSQLQQSPLFDDLETGRISGDEFIEAIRQKAGAVSLSSAQVTDAWNAMLLSFPMRRLQLLQQLRNHYDLFLLSNTNEIHELAFNEIIRAQHGLQPIASFFDRVYFSHRVGMRKPDAEIFLHILEENKLEAAQTLFIDDSPQHIETAKKLGLQTFYLQKGATIEDDVFRPKG